MNNATTADRATFRACYGQKLLDYADARKISLAAAAELHDGNQRYASMSPREKLSHNAKTVAAMRGITYAEALVTLGVNSHADCDTAIARLGLDA